MRCEAAPRKTPEALECEYSSRKWCSTSHAESQAHAVGELDLLEGVLDEPLLAVVAPRAGDLVLVEDPEAHGREPSPARLQRGVRPVRLAAPLPPPVPRSPHVPLRPVPAPGRAGRPVVRARRAPPRRPATDGPGALSHFDLARKDCVGTARNTTSKVWFTVADGVLSDVYFPTNDNTNVETLQYIVTDGSTFTDLQTRDTTYTVKATDDRALTCRVTTTAKSGRYKIVTDYTTDPSRPTVLIRSKFVALKGGLSDYRLYVRHDPTLNGNGGGGTGNGGADDGALATAGGHTLLVGIGHRHADQRGQPRLRDARLLGARRQPRLRPGDQRLRRPAQRRPRAARRRPRALDAPRRRRARQRRAGGARAARPRRRASRSRSATATPRPAPSPRASARSRTASTTPAATTSAAGTPTTTSSSSRGGPTASRRGHWSDILDEYYLSANYVKAAEDKTFPGAVAAALTSPWGQAVSAGDPTTPTSAPTARSSPATSTRRGRRSSSPATAARRTT